MASQFVGLFVGRKFVSAVAFGLIVTVAALLGLAPATALCQAASTNDTALQTLVNDVAYQLELTYRGRTSEHRQRYQQVQQAIDAWKQSGRTQADRTAMEQWLREALQASMPGARAGMPATPAFDPPPAASPQIVFSPPAEVVSPPDLLPAPANPATVSAPPAWEAPSAPAGREPQTELSSVIAPEPFEFAPQAEVAPPGFATNGAPSSDAPPRVASAEPATDAKAHPATAAIDWGDPFRDDPVQPADLAANGSSTKGQTTSYKPVQQTAEVKVDLSELSARVRGYAKGLEKIEAELIASPNATAFQLAGWTREMESLASQRGLIDLYYESLSEVERMVMEEVPSNEGVIRLLGSRAEARTTELSNAESSSAEAERAVLMAVERKLGNLRKNPPIAE